MAGPGVVKGGGCGRGMCPLPREVRKFFLLHSKNSLVYFTQKANYITQNHDSE